MNSCSVFRSCSGGTGSQDHEEAAGCTMSDTNVPYEMSMVERVWKGTSEAGEMKEV
ncbi:MAG: hypothetical protein KGZ74_12035 [Chitinophagaceae bacterium]|nr:hypothetical protein [Chitinophagaceae bacterium]